MRYDSMGLFWNDAPARSNTVIKKTKAAPPEPVWLRDDYLPGLAEAQEFNLPIMTLDEIIQAQKEKHELLFDIEVYKNYFLAGFRSNTNNKTIYVEARNDEKIDTDKLRWIIENFRIVGFNSRNYDLPIITAACTGRPIEWLKDMSDRIIQGDENGYNILRAFKIKALKCDHIDIQEPCPGFGSLKIYGGRVHTPSMQDLPFPPECVLSQEQMDITRWYCLKKDLTSTQMLYNAIQEEIELRYDLSNEYKLDLRSKSDAQIAEAVIASEIYKATGEKPERPEIRPGHTFQFRMPEFLRFETPMMRQTQKIIRDLKFTVEENGTVDFPKKLKNLKIPIGSSVYRMGKGGLHSTEKKAFHREDGEYIIRDKDVTSFYPMIILNQGLYPKHLGKTFLKIFRKIVNRRIDAKHKGLKKIASILKIVINGTYGKLGSPYSIIYSPELMIQVTLTGQLSLLMLAERLELAGISVISGNTDGIVIKCKRTMEAQMEAIIKQWEQDTQFEMEETKYFALLSRDVNNYIAIKEADENGNFETKSKGAYADFTLQINPTSQICVTAVKEYLTKGTNIERTIRGCQDIRQFVTVRKVKGGAVKMWSRAIPLHSDKPDLLRKMGFEKQAGVYWKHPEWNEGTVAATDTAYDLAVKMCPMPEPTYLGSSIRWYYARQETGNIVYAQSGNTVPKSLGAKPLMDLPDSIPSDVDYDWYIQEAQNILADINFS